MSATGRGRERNARDFYRTPRWCVEALLEHEPIAPPFTDPCCGDGAILEVLSERGEAFGVDIHAPSVHACIEAWLDAGVADFLGDLDWEGQQGSVVMNPPYRQAAEFVRAALGQQVRGSKVAALLRLNFLGSSRKRIDLVGPGSCLRSVLVLSRRPSFTGDGRTDACEYAWFVWEVGYTGSASLRVLDASP